MQELISNALRVVGFEVPVLPEPKQVQLFSRSFGPENKEAEGGSRGHFPERANASPYLDAKRTASETSVSSLGKVYLNTAETGFDMWKRFSLRDNQEELEALIMARQKRSKCDRDSTRASMSRDPNGISMDDTMQSSAALGPGSLISESARILELVFQDPFYAVYSAESTTTGAKIGITEYYPADLVARAPSGDVLLQSLELQNLFNLGRDRFMAEAKALASLSHPNLLHFDGVVFDHGTACALHAPDVGQSITNLIKSSSQPPSQEKIDASLKQLAPALELVHSRNLIHANITPDTILLRPDPLLIRFGRQEVSSARADARRSIWRLRQGIPRRSFISPMKRRMGLFAMFIHWLLFSITSSRAVTPSMSSPAVWGIPCRRPLRCPLRSFALKFLEAIDRGLELEPNAAPRT